MLNKNLLFYDFETTGLNHKICSVLELGFLMTKDLKHFSGTKLKFKFEKSFDECSEEERQGLIFNKITNQKELDFHNSNYYFQSTLGVLK